MRALGQQEVRLLERIEHREAVGDHRGVVVLQIEDRAEREKVVEGLHEPHARIRAAHAPLPVRREPQPVVMVVLVRPPSGREPVLLILDDAPQRLLAAAAD